MIRFKTSSLSYLKSEWVGKSDEISGVRDLISGVGKPN